MLRLFYVGLIYDLPPAPATAVKAAPSAEGANAAKTTASK